MIYDLTFLPRTNTPKSLSLKNVLKNKSKEETVVNILKVHLLTNNLIICV